MKASELMCGDWISYIEDGKLYYARVSEVYKPSVFTDDGEFEGRDVEEDEIIPVQITPEILEKSGWKKVGEDERTGVSVMQIEYDGNAFWWTEMNGECGCEDVENEDGEEKFVKVFSCVQVCYVHELQHALRLCGIDKEIVI